MKFIIRSLKHLIWKIFQMLLKNYSSEVRQIQKSEKAVNGFSGFKRTATPHAFPALVPQS